MASTLLAKYGTYEEELMGHVEAITAHAGGGQGSATALTKKFNQIDTCATNFDSCVLAISKKGYKQVVFNNTAKTATIFPQVGESLNGVVNASVNVGPGQTLTFECSKDGQWICYTSSSGIVFNAIINLTSGNILTLHSVPIVAIPAVTGMVTAVIDSSTNYTKSGANYTGGGNARIYTSGDATGRQWLISPLTAGASFWKNNDKGSGGSAGMMASNTNIMIGDDTADYANGSGTAKIYLNYIQYPA
jgi:hypothetical protein